jgi:hypothetical protein
MVHSQARFAEVMMYKIFGTKEDIENKMYLEMQRWAIEQAMAY